MWFTSLLRFVRSSSRRQRTQRRRPAPYRLTLEPLEDRCLLSYSIADLGAITPAAVNNLGVVAGTYNSHAFIEQNGVLTDLGTLGGTSSAAYGINDYNQVVGSASLPDGSQHAALWQNGMVVDLGPAVAYGINNHSQIVGQAGFHVVWWNSTGVMQDLGTFGGTHATATAINNNGQIVGTTYYTVSGTSWLSGERGFIWDPNAGSSLLPLYPGDSASRATALNDAGQVVGTAGTIAFGALPNSGHYSAQNIVLWPNATSTPANLVSITGYSGYDGPRLAINNNEQVVGYGSLLWQGGTWIDLNSLLKPSLGWTISGAAALNDLGQVIGQGTFNNQTQAYLMSPDPSQLFRLVVTGFPSPTNAGVAGSFTVTAVDGSGATASGYTGTIHFTSSDAQAGLPSDYTFSAADGGVHTFSATLKTAGTQSLTATDGMSGISGVQGSITVQAAAVSRFALTGFATAITAGVAGSLTVTAQDTYGNTISGYTGTIHFTSSDPQAVLPADYTFTAADQGVHTFSATLKTAGAQSIAAIDVLMASLAGSETGILVNPAAAYRLRITGPSSVSAGTRFSITVTLLDAYGNVATGYRGTVVFKSSDGSASLPRNYTFTAADAGVHTFTGLILKKKGTQTITVTDTLITTITDSLSVNVV